MDLKLKNNNNIVIPLYNQVEYIESIGTPNINTGITVGLNWTDGYIIDCVIEVLENVSGDSPQIYFNDNFDNGYLGIKCSEDSDNTFLVYGRTSKASVSYATIEFNGKVTIQQKGYSSNNTDNYITVNGIQTTLYPGNVAKTLGNIRILNSGEVRTRIYSFKIQKYSGSGDVYNTVRDYIPVISLQSGHIGEACLYDKVSNSYYYSASTGSFTAPTQGLYDIINTIYIKDCPSINGIDVLRKSYNLERVRCDLGNVTGHLSEIYKYSNLSGFNDNYENQTKPRLIGTFNIDDYYTNSEIYNISEKLDGTTINTLNPTQYNVDTLLENDNLAIQTLDSTKPNYNPAVAIRLYSKGYGHTIINPLLTGEGRFFITKDEVATITSVGTTFTGVNTVTDTNSIVSSDNTATYDFTSFNEFKYFGVTAIPEGGNGTGIFFTCNLLESVELPEGLQTIAGYNFRSMPALERIVIPSTITTINTYNFVTYNTPIADSDVYFNGTLSQWMQATIDGSPTAPGVHFYIGGNEVTSLSIPENITRIKNNTFSGFKYVTGNLTIPNSVTLIGNSAFKNCTGLTSISIPNSVTSIGSDAFNGCSGITGSITIPNSVTSIGSNVFNGCSGLTGKLTIPNSVTSIGNKFSVGCTNLNLLENNSTISLSAYVFSGTYKDGATLITKGSISGATGSNTVGWTNIIIYGNLSMASYPFSYSDRPKIIRIEGNYTGSTTNVGLVYATNGPRLEFIEVMGSVGNAHFVYNNSASSTNSSRRSSGDYWHFGSSSVIPADRVNGHTNHWDKTNMVWVGNGSSRTNDEAVLALYLADSNWSSYSSKLATWYDYNGEYKWYYVTDNLTNCTNTNPDEWPHITRGKSYQTTIVPDEGMTLDSVTVEMYEAVDDGVTPNTPTDITSSVYDSSTGEINIPSVTGNIIITAMAS